MRRVTLAARRAQQFLRKPPKPRWWRPAVRVGSIGIAIGIGWGALWWGTASGALDDAWTATTGHFHEATAALGLVVGDIELQGQQRADRDRVSAILEDLRGAPLLAVNTERVRIELERLPWIDHAIVRRALPGVVSVHLFERQPLALWQREGAFHLIDRNGEMILIPLDDDLAVASWRHLRVIVGEGAPARAAALFAVLSTDPELFARVEAAMWIGGRRWSIRFDSETDVLLPEDRITPAWQTLGRLQRRDRLLERAIGTIDLRFLPDRLRLRLLPEALPERAA